MLLVQYFTVDTIIHTYGKGTAENEISVLTLRLKHLLLNDNYVSSSSTCALMQNNKARAVSLKSLSKSAWTWRRFLFFMLFNEKKIKCFRYHNEMHLLCESTPDVGDWYWYYLFTLVMVEDASWLGARVCKKVCLIAAMAGRLVGKAAIVTGKR